MPSHPFSSPPMTTSTRNRPNERIVRRAAGDFLDPPLYPTHTWHVETDCRRHRRNRGFCSLSYAVTQEWIDPSVRAEAQQLLDAWHDAPPAVESEEVQAWIHRVLGYFKNCYVNPATGSRHVADLLICPDLDPMEATMRHAGVLLIRDFYPDWLPERHHFDTARWGA